MCLRKAEATPQSSRARINTAPRALCPTQQQKSRCPSESPPGSAVVLGGWRGRRHLGHDALVRPVGDHLGVALELELGVVAGHLLELDLLVHFKGFAG